MRKHIMIAIPAYTGMVHIGTSRALIADTVALLQRGDIVTLQDDIGCCDLYDTRARTMARFLEQEPRCTHLMLVDNDVAWKNGSILRLIDHPVDFVAGLYPKRQDPLKFDLHFLDNEKRTLPGDPNTGLLEVAAVSAGFMRLTRNVIESMVEHYKDDPIAGMYVRPEGKGYGLWDQYRIPGEQRKLGDDISFCRRWRDMGGKIWLDPSIPMAHMGLKVFQGTFADHLQAQPANQKAA